MLARAWRSSSSGSRASTSTARGCGRRRHGEPGTPTKGALPIFTNPFVAGRTQMATGSSHSESSVPNPRFAVGTSGFAYDAWRGSLYPEKLPAKRFLEHYAQRFSTTRTAPPASRTMMTCRSPTNVRLKSPGFGISASRPSFSRASY